MNEWVLKIKLISQFTFYSILFFKTHSYWFFAGNFVPLQIQSKEISFDSWISVLF